MSRNSRLRNVRCPVEVTVGHDGDTSVDVSPSPGARVVGEGVVYEVDSSILRVEGVREESKDW